MVFAQERVGWIRLMKKSNTEIEKSQMIRFSAVHFASACRHAEMGERVDTHRLGIVEHLSKRNQYAFTTRQAKHGNERQHITAASMKKYNRVAANTDGQ